MTNHYLYIQGPFIPTAWFQVYDFDLLFDSGVYIFLFAGGGQKYELLKDWGKNDYKP